MSIVFETDGTARCLHTELIPLEEIGTMTVKRASNVEFDETTQCWFVESLNGERLFTDKQRSNCLKWESENL